MVFCCKLALIALFNFLIQDWFECMTLKKLDLRRLTARLGLTYIFPIFCQTRPEGPSLVEVSSFCISMLYSPRQSLVTQLAIFAILIVKNILSFYPTPSLSTKKEALEPRVAHSCRSLSRFLQHEAARSISTSPGRDASPSQVTSPQFIRFPQQFAGTHLYTRVERGTESKVSCPRTQRKVPSKGSNQDQEDRQILRRAHKPLPRVSGKPEQRTANSREWRTANSLAC